MTFAERLQALRQRSGLSQEELAVRLCVARQTVGKWETGQAVPELAALIALSDLHHVPIDRLVRPEDDCAAPIIPDAADELAALPGFLLRAKRATYAGHGAEAPACRPGSHDLRHAEGDWRYLDSYLGGSAFAGEEAVWLRGRPVWSMNYAGRVTNQTFSGDFLKEALYQPPAGFLCAGLRYTAGASGRTTASRTAVCPGSPDGRRSSAPVSVYEARFHGGLILE